MKEIKFKAWDKKLRCMDLLTGFNLVGRKAIQIYYLDEDGDRSTRTGLVEDIELLQYTGIKDKNGVEICEGDIVQIKDHTSQKKPGNPSGIEIEGYYPVSITDRMELVAGHWLLWNQRSYITVVGNIYENLELLE